MDRSIDNLISLGEENLNFLKNSLTSFYKGERYEIKRISSVIRTFVHQTNSSHSLLNQIQNHPDNKYTQKLKIFDNGIFPKNLLIPGSIYLGVTIPIIPLNISQEEFLKNFKHLNSIQDWWEKVILMCTNTEKPFWSRKDLVLKYANKEGGSHVDPKIPKDFMEAQNSFQYIDGNYEFGVGYIIVYEAGLTLFHSLYNYLSHVKNKS
jgi:hypothetical protein